MIEESSDSMFSSRWGELTIRECPDRDDAEWLLYDEVAEAGVPIWPSDVPELCVMLESFENTQSQAIVESSSQPPR